MNSIKIAGPFNSGKSTLFNILKDVYKEDNRFMFVEEEARKYIERLNKPATDLNKEEIIEMQAHLIRNSILKEEEAEDLKKIAVCDTSLLENIAYIQDYITQKTYEIVNNSLKLRAQNYRVIYLPPKREIALVNDGVRHVEDGKEEQARDLQEKIGDRIKILIREHNIRHYIMDSVNLQERVMTSAKMLEHVYSEQAFYDGKS